MCAKVQTTDNQRHNAPGDLSRLLPAVRGNIQGGDRRRRWRLQVDNEYTGVAVRACGHGTTTRSRPTHRHVAWTRFPPPPPPRFSTSIHTRSELHNDNGPLLQIHQMCI